ncbi:CPBP family intramembrane glutamic endopeptidase [Cohnella terricola]|uniref:CPBP family intramembrane metalloprotease n=1 Tax=Cohnella terricola TaxID=1289167 RepID=A0A559JTM5_9BACL|nr:CPBP family intramembrane glutamic endopeptidase [Cohnella terricola]TVY03190.1 CPBP family intramembrane metalloprotease [Cohnella terricola]
MHKQDGYSVKRPYLLILWIELALIVCVAGGSAYVSIAEMTHPLAPFLGFVPIALFLLIYLSVTKNWRTFYFGSLRSLTAKQWAEYLPLLLILILLVVGNRGFQDQPVSFFVYMLLSQLLLVGFVEETLFRGIILRALIQRGKAVAVGVSSILFGVTHALQALGGQSLEDTMLQIAYAFILGFVLALLVVKNKAILPSILFHGLHNFINFTGNAPSTHVYDFLVIAILIAQLMWLLRPDRNKVAILA